MAYGNLLTIATGVWLAALSILVWFTMHHGGST